MINKTVIEECTSQKLTFPEVVVRLREIGIERYLTDLVKMEKTYYSSDGETYVEPLIIKDLEPVKNFNDEKIIKSIHAIQQEKIDYPTFLREIIAAGIAYYSVFLAGNYIVYVGHKGEIYKEKFPSHLHV